MQAKILNFYNEIKTSFMVQDEPIRIKTNKFDPSLRDRFQDFLFGEEEYQNVESDIERQNQPLTPEDHRQINAKLNESLYYNHGSLNKRPGIIKTWILDPYEAFKFNFNEQVDSFEKQADFYLKKVEDYNLKARLTLFFKPVDDWIGYLLGDIERDSSDKLYFKQNDLSSKGEFNTKYKTLGHPSEASEPVWIQIKEWATTIINRLKSININNNQPNENNLSQNLMSNFSNRYFRFPNPDKLLLEKSQALFFKVPNEVGAAVTDTAQVLFGINR